MNLFVYSSPLHFLFATVIAKNMGGRSIGLYTPFAKDFSSTFAQISKYTAFSFDESYDFSELMQLREKFEIRQIFLPNRFQYEAVCIFNTFKSSAKINLYEEGAALYLSSLHVGHNISDQNRTLWVKNFLRSCFGLPKSHIYLNSFSNIYCMFPDMLPALSEKGQSLQPLFSSFLSGLPKARESQKGILILSQWFVSENVLTEKEYIHYLCDISSRLGYEQIFYKPHPRDSESLTQQLVNKHDFKLLPAPFDEDLPIELFLIANPLIDIVGFWTSTLLYTQHLLPNNVFSIYSDFAQFFPNNMKLQSMYKKSSGLLEKFGICPFKQK